MSKKLNEETKNALVKKAKENDAYLAQALKFIGDFGKYKERKKYPMSDIEYKKSMKQIQSHILSVFHNYNISMEILKLHKLTDEHKDVLEAVNEIILEEIRVQVAEEKNQAEIKPALKIVKEGKDEGVENISKIERMN